MKDNASDFVEGLLHRHGDTLFDMLPCSAWLPGAGELAHRVLHAQGWGAVVMLALLVLPVAVALANGFVRHAGRLAAERQWSCWASHLSRTQAFSGRSLP